MFFCVNLGMLLLLICMNYADTVWLLQFGSKAKFLGSLLYKFLSSLTADDFGRLFLNSEPVLQAFFLVKLSCYLNIQA